ncbi:MAG: 8-oxoguanine DNA glycosylase [Betaproteobacteria bacterium]|nr:8-oxoguanine DNA glycosylase [Betaproteobacteria bacterium]MBU6511748.1 8-oxoguanine DNA glycosylase [Betaproteobacteria bacterium]MDE1954241.1 8-oxoguanine DNA glycosylase [Betaproteobacteria bacterium]MDE2153304.1 8-oxoguanine DNA glycosylase [Betaproteobacteria bacterium]
MTQTAAVFVGRAAVQVELPSSDVELLPGLPWGSVEAFPTPAYWMYQVLASRLIGRPVRYRLGQTLVEEVGACLLGGHGIPAAIGVAAFCKLRDAGVFARSTTEQELYALLGSKVALNGRQVGYRFAKQKARYLQAALKALESGAPASTSGRELRDWLAKIPGIGYKTASWIARNWLDAGDVAILDIHILRAGFLGGFFSPGLTVERNYLQLEREFLALSVAMGVSAAELDAVIWLEMMSSPATVASLMGGHRHGVQPTPWAKRSPASSLQPRAKKQDADALQSSLIK